MKRRLSSLKNKCLQILLQIKLYFVSASYRLMPNYVAQKEIFLEEKDLSTMAMVAF